MRREFALLDLLGLVVQGFIRRRELVKIVRATANSYLILGIVMVVMMMVVVVTRGLMMKLLIMLRSRMTSLRHRSLMEAATGRRMMVMMMMVFPVSGLLNMIVLMRIHWRYNVLLLIRIGGRRRVIQIGVAQTVLRGNDRRGGAILVENGTRRRVEALRRRTGRRA